MPIGFDSLFKIAQSKGSCESEGKRKDREGKGYWYLEIGPMTMYFMEFHINNLLLLTINRKPGSIRGDYSYQFKSSKFEWQAEGLFNLRIPPDLM